MIAKSANCRGRSGKQELPPEKNTCLVDFNHLNHIKILCAPIFLLNPSTETRALRDLKFFDFSLEFFSANCK